MNVIIMAACIPTLRPLFRVIFRRPSVSQYQSSGRNRRHSSYQRTPGSNDTKNLTARSAAPTKAFGAHKTRFSGGAGAKAPQNTKFSDTNCTISSTTTVRVYSREVRSREEEGEEGEWGHSKGSGVPLSTINWSGRESAMD